MSIKMIKISIRDSFADLPPSLLKKKLQERMLEQKKINDVIRLTNFYEIVKAIPYLEQLFEEKKIESRPVLNHSASDYLEWHDENNYEHRENNLPSTSWKENNDFGYKKRGEIHRTNGPAWISPNVIQWAIDGKQIAKEVKSDREYYDNSFNLITKKEYEDIVKKNFPNVGNKLHVDDWQKDPRFHD